MLPTLQAEAGERNPRFLLSILTLVNPLVGALSPTLRKLDDEGSSLKRMNNLENDSKLWQTESVSKR